MAEVARDKSLGQVLRIGLMIASVGLVCVLLLGPVWVIPVHPASGLPFHELEGHADYGSDYVAKTVPQYTLAIFVLCMGLWLTNLIPLAATGLLAVALLPLLNVVEPKQAFAYFGNSAVLFILSVFFFAAAMIRTGLSKRLTLLLLNRFDRHPTVLVVGVLCSSAFLALWMPAYAVAAMMFPLILEIADTLELKKGKSGFAKTLFFALAWGAVIGGCGTFLGGARAPLAVELLRDTYGAEAAPISFLDWMRVAMPLVVVMVGVAIIVLLKFLPPDVSDISAATRMLNARVAALGKMSPQEQRLAVVGLLTVFCWIFLGQRFDIAVIAVLSAVTLFALKIVDWQEAQPYVNWGVVVMYGGAVALGAALKDSHAMLWLVQEVMPAEGVNPTVLLAMMAVLSLVLSIAISNAAAVAVLLPVGFALCDVAEPGVSPEAMMYAVAVSSGLVFALPISSPPLAVCFASGYYSLKDVTKYGVPLTLIGLVMVLLWVVFYLPHM